MNGQILDLHSGIMLICGGNQAELSLITKHLLFLLSGVFNFLLIKIKRTFSRSEGGICEEQDRMCFFAAKIKCYTICGGVPAWREIVRGEACPRE